MYDSKIDCHYLKAHDILFIYVLRMDASGVNEFYAGRVETVDSRDSAIIWINQNPAIMNSLDDTQELHVDATFKSVPSIFSHLATIHLIAPEYVTSHNF